VCYTGAVVKTVAQGWVPLSHGSATSYNRGCPCDLCKAKNTARNTTLRTRRMAQRVLINGRLVAPLPPEKHGKQSTYSNWGCRCIPCTDANTIACSKKAK
jgi:hypothetical protein